MKSIVFQTNFGWMAAVFSEGKVAKIILPQKKQEHIKRLLGRQRSKKDNTSKALSRLEWDITMYLSGENVIFSRYRTRPDAGTTFQQRVWHATAEIAPGKTKTYGEIARIVGSPNAARAVGAALKANPTPLLVPCHRVVSSKGLGGYAGGKDLKRKLLELEGAL
jgi:methylated-DNA-[protein]-cysteine S-methyltransferase